MIIALMVIGRRRTVGGRKTLKVAGGGKPTSLRGSERRRAVRACDRRRGQNLAIQLQQALPCLFPGGEPVGGLLIHGDAEAQRISNVAVSANRTDDKVCSPEVGPQPSVP